MIHITISGWGWGIAIEAVLFVLIYGFAIGWIRGIDVGFKMHKRLVAQGGARETTTGNRQNQQEE